MTENKKQRLIIGISGASGFQYGVRLLELLKPLNIETHLIITKAAQLVRAAETPLSAKEVIALADHYYAYEDVACAVASGSYITAGMIVAPCSMRSLAEIATGVTSNALTRAADVVLKERRRLVLMVRESPLHAGHLHNMQQATQLGAIIAPPIPAFYNKPQTLADMIDHTLGRVLDLFDIDVGVVRRWRSH